ncbi:MAG TPA: sigma 54-interacting transcriptional regulator [Syntrophomonadaceae bacterium]|nr:sigma 54-interacting transcriptional regulator [Syntrophomonadaceae bacterium]HQE23204.1 sigma 54-interacting transcriptional regulator [Syntrophomonadaceae bacterium]
MDLELDKWLTVAEYLSHLGRDLKIKSSLKVKDFMRCYPELLTAKDSIKSAVEIMVSDSIDAVPIVDEAGNLEGLVTKTLVLREILNGTDLQQPISQIMISGVESIDPEEDVSNLITINVGNLPVLSNKKVVGMVTLSDTIRAYFSSLITLHMELNAVINSTHNGILTVNEAGEISLVNQAAESILGIKREDVAGKKISQVLPQSKLPEILASGQNRLGQKVVYNKKGFISNLTPVVGNKQIIGAVEVIQDISELEMISEELSYTKQMKEELSVIIDSSFDGFHITDNHGKTLRINKAFERITSIPFSDLMGKTIAELVEAGVYSQDVLQLVLEKREPVTFSQESKPGNTVIITANPVFDEQDNLFRIVINVRDISELNDLRRQLAQAQTLSHHYQEELNRYNLADQYVIRSKESRDLADLCVRLGQVDATVLIKGESGVGKEFAAQIIHSNSKRRDKPMIKVNCAAIPENLFESELFGYEPGAFTGASKEGKPGLFEAANGGTLLLDEIGEMPLSTQAKLLRAIQDKEITRVGGTKPIKIDVRLIAATNRNLQEMVRNKEFRRDLYFRLNVIPVTVPPLRDRKVEIPFLVDHFVKKFNAKYNFKKRIDERQIKVLMNYDWPGNIRELENLIERVLVTSPGNVIRHINLHDFDRTDYEAINYEHFIGFKLQDAVEQLEKYLIQNSLETLGTTRRAAQELGVSQPTIVRKAAKYNIPLKSPK